MSKFVKIPLIGPNDEGKADDGFVRKDQILAVVTNQGETFIETENGLFKSPLSPVEVVALVDAAE